MPASCQALRTMELALSELLLCSKKLPWGSPCARRAPREMDVCATWRQQKENKSIRRWSGSLLYHTRSGCFMAHGQRSESLPCLVRGILPGAADRTRSTAQARRLWPEAWSTPGDCAPLERSLAWRPSAALQPLPSGPPSACQNFQCKRRI